ncbi:MAG: MarR family transcriptional regulator, partial [Sporomusaceae bacterium]|nr:MarR family transcriptional regulator [Sporomusaceae bacterium]
ILKEQEALTQIALANYLNVEPAAISKTLVKLEKKELVVRQVGQDKREKIISLTAKAQESYEMWQQIVGEHRRQFLQDISAEQLTLMRRLLQTMAKHAK